MFLPSRNRILFYNSYILTHLDFCCIIWGNCSSTLENKHVKFQKRAARVILDCDFYTPSLELFKELNWQNCPDYLKNYVSYTSDISCRDNSSTNCNQLYTPKPNFSASHSCTLELPSGILSPYMLKMLLRLTLLNVYI